MKNYSLVIALFLLLGLKAQSQILISLIFGDKLNSENIEFGLEGGANFSSLERVSSNSMTNFNLGFYFDFNIKKDIKWKFNTGVIVKSTMGAEDIDVYSIDNVELDKAFLGGSIERKINYFNVPLVLKRQVAGGLYVGVGGMLGLRTKAFDIFTQKVNEADDLTYKLDIKDNLARIDAGLLFNLNYKILKSGEMNFFVKYYYGLLDINDRDMGDELYNRSVYFGAGIPIGGVKTTKKTN